MVTHWKNKLEELKKQYYEGFAYTPSSFSYEETVKKLSPELHKQQIELNKHLLKTINENFITKKQGASMSQANYPDGTYFMLWTTTHEEGHDIDHWNACTKKVDYPYVTAYCTDYRDALEFAQKQGIEEFYLVQLRGIMTIKVENSLKKTC